MTGLLIAGVIGLVAGGGITFMVVDGKADKEIATLTGDLEACRAEQTPKSIAATADVLEASQAGDVADAAHATRVAELTGADLYAAAVIELGSPCVTATSAALAQCHASNTAGDSARSGCGPQGAVTQAWAQCVAKLDACAAQEPTEAPE